ncbi:MAG: hypothetical protein CVT62_04180 [Actinobacteria bacterium HGW-Actinobacteria-2]|nr:MAG: hypothetical protein CVT62_04180 [Actinobacteria bacterium HGW-Actinobacteria-2]
MSTLKLWAISIDEVRSIFRAEPPLADQLRQAARERFGTSGQQQPGLLGKLGPFLRNGGDPAAPRPGVPNAEDVDNLLSGRFVPPHRLVEAWNLLDFWLDTLAAGSGRWPLTEGGLNEFDFDLVRAEVSARYGLSELFKANLGISLTRCGGLAAGWVSGSHAQGMRQAWPDRLDELSPAHREFAEAIIEFLAHFEEWNSAAEAAGRAHPDLVAIFRS